MSLPEGGRHNNIMTVNWDDYFPSCEIDWNFFNFLHVCLFMIIMQKKIEVENKSYITGIEIKISTNFTDQKVIKPK